MTNTTNAVARPSEIQARIQIIASAKIRSNLIPTTTHYFEIQLQYAHTKRADSGVKKSCHHSTHWQLVAVDLYMNIHAWIHNCLYL